MIISIEVPVFKGQFLQKCIDSVFAQTNTAWELSLVWDGGDDLSREILEKINAAGYPNVKVFFTANQGIARARAFLTSQNNHAYILPLDDDDELAPTAVEIFMKAARANPWASLIRSKRGFINEQSEKVDEAQWFPFSHRKYYKGMVTDIFNQSQPYLIKRTAYEKTLGWRGFDDFMQAGEDCDIFLQLEEVAHFELIDDLLYHYRLHNARASNELTSAAAFEMWRRLADEALKRMRLNLIRTNETPPFTYKENVPVPRDIHNVDFILEHKSTLSQTLREFGIDEESIIETTQEAKDLTWKMEGFRTSQKELVCFMDRLVVINDLNAIVDLVGILNETGADVVAPGFNLFDSDWGEKNYSKRSSVPASCLLVKREVMLATGGFDQEFIPAHLQGVDFCIQVRRREFTCYEARIPGINYRENPNKRWKEDDLIPLKEKWHSHQQLQSSISDLNNFSGDGARL